MSQDNTDLAERFDCSLVEVLYDTVSVSPCVHLAGSLRSIYHASRDRSELGFYLCSVAKSRLCSIYLCVRILPVLSFEGITPDWSYKGTLCEFNVRLWWTNSPRLDRWPQNQLFSSHCTTQAQSGIAVITTPASPHWAIPHSVEYIANVITLSYTFLWPRLNVECHLRARCHSKRFRLVYKGTCLLYHALGPLAPVLAEPSWFPGSFLNVKLNCMTWPKLTPLRILQS